MLSKATHEVLYIKIYNGLRYVFLKLFWNFWNVPMRDPEPSQLALSIHVYGCQLDELRLPGYRQQCIIWFHSCVYVIMQYFFIFDCTLLENKLTTTTTTTMLCIAMKFININGLHCHKSYVWWIEQFVQQPFRCDSRYILRILENITPDAGLALVVPEPSCSITFLTEHIYGLHVKHC